MLSTSSKEQLRIIAYSSIDFGLEHERPLPLNLSTMDEELHEQAASFVTLEMNGQLRGCIGVLEAFRPLAEDVAVNSYAAAFSDPRFPSLKESEFELITIKISVLSQAETIVCDSETTLIEQLRPNIDGLILQDGNRRATFLPSVWESLSDPISFVRQLKNKAGFNHDYWSTDMQVFRYTTESF